MVTAGIASLAVLAGAPWWSAALVFALSWNPVVALGAMVAVAAVTSARSRRGPAPDDEVEILRDLVSELRSGASIRSAVAGVGAVRGGMAGASRLAAAGRPMDAVGRALNEAMPRYGRLVAATMHVSSIAGGPAVPGIESVAVAAADDAKLIKERRAATAQARASAWVVASLPVLLLALYGVSGRLSGAGTLVMVGAFLQLAGVVVIVAMVRGVAR